MRKPRLTRFLPALATALLLALPVGVSAQIGEHRNDFSVGVNGGYVLSSVGFMPKIPQGMHGGITGGVSARYVCEKYYTMICSVLAEVNYAMLGWKEDILDIDDQPVLNPQTGLAEEYSRTINYVQVPIFAHLAWGREKKGANFFFQAGPQFGLYLGESSKANFDMLNINLSKRSNPTTEQYSMEVEKKFDYGIAAGLGIEYSVPALGHFLIEGRYYYGLGNIYGSSKRDFFGKSNFGSIYIKATYLFDI